MLRKKKEMNAKIIFVVALFVSVKNSIGESRLFLLKTCEIIKRLEIRHGIFVWDENNNGNIFGNVRDFSHEGIMSTAMSHEKLSEYFQVGSFPNVRTIIIMKERNLLKIIEMFENFECVVQKAYRFTWIVFVEFYNSIDGQKLNILYNCRFLIAYPIKEKEFKFVEVFKVKNQSFFFDFETFADGQPIVPNDYLYMKRMNLNRTKMVLNFDDKSFLRREHVATTRQIEILNDIARFMNFEYTLKKFNLVDPKNITLLDGDLSDLMCPFHSDFFTFDFLGPMFKILINWNIKYPDVKNHGDYIKPFHPNLWRCIFSFVIFSSLTLIVMKNIIKERFSNVEVAFVGLDSLCNQDGNDFKKDHFRIISLALRIMALVVMAAYSATITSYLAIRQPQIPFSNLEEFSSDGSYLLAMPRQSFTYHYFKDSNDDTIKHIYSNLSSAFEFGISNKIIQRFCFEKFAMPTVDNEMYSFNLECEFFQIEKAITFTFSGILLKKNSPFKEVLNYKLLWFYTSGIQEKLQKKTQEYPTISPIEDVLDPVEIQQIIQIFFVGGIGLIVASITFICEISFQKFRNARGGDAINGREYTI